MATNFGRHTAGSSDRPARREAPAARRVAPAEPEEGISTIRAGQGARVTTRKNAAQVAGRARKNTERRYYERHPEARKTSAGPERSGRNVVLLVVVSVLALALVFLAVRLVTILMAPDPEAQAQWEAQQLDAQTSSQEDAQRLDAAFEQASVDGTVSFSGYAYALSQADGQWSVVRRSASGDATTLFLIEGAPAALMRHGDAILVPESRDGGWDVVCYVINGHTDGASYVTSDGAMVQGSGDITSAELSEGLLRVSDSTGATTDVSLS